MRQGTRFEFTRGFLPNYEASKLSTMRNRLVHNYVLPPNGYGFSLGLERAAEHPAPADRQRIIVELLADDVERAAAALFARAEEQPNVRQNLIARLRTPGLLLVEPSDVG